MPGEINATPRSTLKYAAMLLLIIGLGWVGVSSEDSGDGGLLSPTARAAVVRESDGSAVLEEKRRRDVEAYPDAYFAGDAVGLKQKDAHSDGGNFIMRFADLQILTSTNTGPGLRANH